jgi:hypothetical protein
MVQSWQYEEPQYWDTYVPQLEDYATTEEWEEALKARSLNTSAVLGPSGRTEQQIAVNRFGGANPGSVPRDKSFNAGMGGAALRLDSSMRVNPEEARLAYMAMDEYGNPMIDPAVQALIERRLGIGAYEAPLPNMNEDTGVPDAVRHSRWWNTPPNENEDTGQTDAGRHGAWWNSGTPPPPPGGGGDGRPPLAPPPDPIGDPGNYPGSGSESGGPYGDPRLANLPPFEPIGDPGVDPTARLAQSTIDPRYPDWLLQANAQFRRRRPIDPMAAPGGLGGY